MCAHYVGDASQPLHGSVLADGDPSRKVKRWHPRTQKWETVIYGKGVHSAYETDMITDKVKLLVEGITAQLPSKHGLKLRGDGRDCAHATLQLMHDVANILPPKTILKSYESALTEGEDAPPRKKGETIINAMWNDLGDKTIEVFIEGARTLALVWDSSWKAGKGSTIDESDLDAIDPNLIRDRYIDTDFVPSKQLDQIGPSLDRAPPECLPTPPLCIHTRSDRRVHCR